jgi:hypothetical protein
MSGTANAKRISKRESQAIKRCIWK